MVCVGLIIQQVVDGKNLFLNLCYYLSMNKALLISKCFSQEIKKIKNDDLQTGTRTTSVPNYRFGSIIALNQYRVQFQLLNEVYIMAVNSVEDNPFELDFYVQKMKSLLISICKGLDVTTNAISRRYGEIFFALEKVVQGEDGSDVLNQKALEISPNSGTKTAYVPGNPGAEQAWKNAISNYDKQAKSFTELSKIEFTIPTISTSEILAKYKQELPSTFTLDKSEKSEDKFFDQLPFNDYHNSPTLFPPNPVYTVKIETDANVKHSHTTPPPTK